MKDIEKIKKINFPCPCGGEVKWVRKKVIQDGVDCGVLDVEVCDKCGTEYLPDWSMEIVENNLKNAGLWAVERKKISFWKSGNSVLFRVPTKIANVLGLKPKGEGYIYQEGKDKLVIDVL